MKKLSLIFVGILFTVSVYSETWSLTGNAGISTSNFLGTTDHKPLILKANNQWAGFTGYPDKNNVSFGYLSLTNALGTGTANTALGAHALQWNSEALGNIAVGTWALQWCTEGDYNIAVGLGAMGGSLKVGSSNTAIGYHTLRNNTSSGNTAIGFEAGLGNKEGASLTAVGFKALRNNTTGGNNTAHGFNALINNTEGFNNTAVGAWTLVANTTGCHNTTIGMKSLYSNTTGEYNTAIGIQALELNTTGYWNVALGSGALNQNTTGYLNTAGGNSSMWFNETGNYNAAFGEQALAGSIDGNQNTAMGCRALWSVRYDPIIGDIGYGHGSNNTAVGYEALRDITTGSSNVGVGMHALRVNSSGNGNIAMGCYALTFNTTGGDNIAVGNHALVNNTTSHGNVAVGKSALMSNKTGNNNTAIGHNADVSAGEFTNATAIGHGAIATASDQVMIGNSSVTSIRAYVPLSTISDERVKKNIQTNVPGLEFINMLQPVTYNLDFDAAHAILKTGKSQENDSQHESAPVDMQARAAQKERVQTGFLAQDVEKAAQKIGYDFSGVDMDKNGNGLYGLRYSKFIVPLVKAVQELSEQSNAKDAAIASLQDRIDQLEEMNNETVASLQDQIEMLTDLVNRLLDKENGSSTDIKKISIPGTSLEQNYPNPFNQSTTINYTLPQMFRSAKIVINDISGRVFMQIPVTTVGNGFVTIKAGSLFAGVYYYSLYVDNTLVDTKKMVLTK